ncbi:Uncharacterised protein at_DN0916 [Pycnogonum litorale]
MAIDGYVRAIMVLVTAIQVSFAQLQDIKEVYCNTSVQEVSIAVHKEIVKISSPNYGTGNYPNEYGCVVRITLNDELKDSVLRAQFSDMDIEDSNNCDADSLHYVLSERSPDSGKMKAIGDIHRCGNDTKKINRDFDRNLRFIYLFFRSNENVTGRGFSLIVKAVPSNLFLNHSNVTRREFNSSAKVVTSNPFLKHSNVTRKVNLSTKVVPSNPFKNVSNS